MSSSTYATLPTSSTHLAGQLRKYGLPHWDLNKSDVDIKPAADSKPDVENNPEVDIQTDVDSKPEVGIKPAADSKPDVENNPEVGIQTDVDSKPPVDYEIHRFFREAELTLLKTYRKPTGAKDTEKEKPAKPGGNWQYNKNYNCWLKRVSGKKSTAKRKEKRAADPVVQMKKQARSASSAD